MHDADQHPGQILVFAMGALCGALIAFFTWAMLTPVDPGPQWFPQIDKLKHFVAFGMIAGPGALILPTRYVGFVLMTAIVLAGGVEVAQEVSGLGRQGSVPDFIAGAVGAGVACWIAPRIARFFARQTPGSAA